MKYIINKEEMGLGKEMDGCGQFMKYSMFISNFIIFVGGVVVLGIGIWTLVDKSFINELLGTNLFVGSIYILIVTGALIALIAFFGCLGAVKEIKCLLLMYFILVFIIFIVMLVGGILGYVYREKARSAMEQEMQRSIRQYGDKQSIRNAWDETQENLHCCGIVSYSDWKNNIPESCCKYISGDRTSGKVKFPCQSAPNPLSIYTEGCLNATERFVRDHAAIIGGAGIGVACIMLLGMIFSCALFKMIE
ncbi:tetraspanin-11-like isoform X1 [Hetaerina americana]|uniref:tetraspanin-11-like isoform X1 n=2 Tax=Hetaerina americana TaxID=62018 RepID=UPI003A7F1632